MRPALLVFAVLAMLAVAFTPAPLPKQTRMPTSQPFAGVWDVDWGGMPVRLQLRPDGSARFEYTKVTGAWDGSWRYDPGLRRVTLTLQFGGRSEGVYLLEFAALGRDWAEGKIGDGRNLKLTRSRWR